MPKACVICGHTEFSFKPVLWDGLVSEWELSKDEAEYIDRQQGEFCTKCNANLRCLALADGLRHICKSELLLKDLIETDAFKKLRILEINEASHLHKWLQKIERGCREAIMVRPIPDGMTTWCIPFSVPMLGAGCFGQDLR